jgi:hypothetical protein
MAVMLTEKTCKGDHKVNELEKQEIAKIGQ